MPKIYIASDHGGYDVRRYLLEHFNLPADCQWVDLGPAVQDPSDDYNSPALAVAKAVLADPGSLGVLICRSGHGICIQANRLKGIRAIMGLTPELAAVGRAHNDANILCLSADFQTSSDMSQVLDTFLRTTFSGEERHQRRINALDKDCQ